MEKRIIIAFVLSFIVLSAWSTLNPQPKKIPIKTSQVIENKEDTVKDVSNNDVSLISSQESPIVKMEEIRILENDKIKVEFSNIGGTIKSVLIKEFNVSLPVTKIFTVVGTKIAILLLNKIQNIKLPILFAKGNKRLSKHFLCPIRII